MPDHVHLLTRLPPTVTVSEFIGQVKGATAFRVNRDLKPKFEDLLKRNAAADTAVTP